MDTEQRQAIGQALSKFDFPGDGIDFKILLLSYAKERDHERFYRHASKLVSEGKLRKVFDRFANDQAAHQEELQEVYEEIKGELDLPDALVSLLEKCPREGPVMRAGVAPGEVFEMAIKAEKDSQLFYEARMEECVEPEVLEMMDYLAALEEEHYIHLKSIQGDMS